MKKASQQVAQAGTTTSDVVLVPLVLKDGKMLQQMVKAYHDNRFLSSVTPTEMDLVQPEKWQCFFKLVLDENSGKLHHIEALNWEQWKAGGQAVHAANPNLSEEDGITLKKGWGLQAYNEFKTNMAKQCDGDPKLNPDAKCGAKFAVKSISSGSSGGPGDDGGAGKKSIDDFMSGVYNGVEEGKTPKQLGGDAVKKQPVTSDGVWFPCETADQQQQELARIGRERKKPRIFGILVDSGHQIYKHVLKWSQLQHQLVELERQREINLPEGTQAPPEIRKTRTALEAAEGVEFQPVCEAASRKDESDPLAVHLRQHVRATTAGRRTTPEEGGELRPQQAQCSAWLRLAAADHMHFKNLNQESGSQVGVQAVQPPALSHFVMPGTDVDLTPMVLKNVHATTLKSMIDAYKMNRLLSATTIGEMHLVVPDRWRCHYKITNDAGGGEGNRNANSRIEAVIEEVWQEGGASVHRSNPELHYMKGNGYESYEYWKSHDMSCRINNGGSCEYDLIQFRPSDNQRTSHVSQFYRKIALGKETGKVGALTPLNGGDFSLTSSGDWLSCEDDAGWLSEMQTIRKEQKIRAHELTGIARDFLRVDKAGDFFDFGDQFCFQGKGSENQAKNPFDGSVRSADGTTRYVTKCRMFVNSVLGYQRDKRHVAAKFDPVQRLPSQHRRGLAQECYAELQNPSNVLPGNGNAVTANIASDISVRSVLTELEMRCPFNMKKVPLEGTKCLDGTPAAYYLETQGHTDAAVWEAKTKKGVFIDFEGDGVCGMDGPTVHLGDTLLQCAFYALGPNGGESTFRYENIRRRPDMVDLAKDYVYINVKPCDGAAFSGNRGPATFKLDERLVIAADNVNPALTPGESADRQAQLNQMINKEKNEFHALLNEKQGKNLPMAENAGQGDYTITFQGYQKILPDLLDSIVKQVIKSSEDNQRRYAEGNSKIVFHGHGFGGTTLYYHVDAMAQKVRELVLGAPDPKSKMEIYAIPNGGLYLNKGVFNEKLLPLVLPTNVMDQDTQRKKYMLDSDRLEPNYYGNQLKRVFKLADPNFESLPEMCQKKYPTNKDVCLFPQFYTKPTMGVKGMEMQNHDARIQTPLLMVQSLFDDFVVAKVLYITCDLNMGVGGDAPATSNPSKAARGYSNAPNVKALAPRESKNPRFGSANKCSSEESERIKALAGEYFEILQDHEDHTKLSLAVPPADSSTSPQCNPPKAEGNAPSSGGSEQELPPECTQKNFAYLSTYVAREIMPRRFPSPVMSQDFIHIVAEFLGDGKDGRKERKEFFETNYRVISSPSALDFLGGPPSVTFREYQQFGPELGKQWGVPGVDTVYLESI
ncbi:unnamed protein product [Amoebophrya sp. A120]|nr:unnamed protein product [Amoebophrya sp. A120]|eukprot:GSA120T00015532001.1